MWEGGQALFQRGKGGRSALLTEQYTSFASLMDLCKAKSLHLYRVEKSRDSPLKSIAHTCLE